MTEAVFFVINWGLLTIYPFKKSSFSREKQLTENNCLGLI